MTFGSWLEPYPSRFLLLFTRYDFAGCYEHLVLTDAQNKRDRLRYSVVYWFLQERLNFPGLAGLFKGCFGAVDAGFDGADIFPCFNRYRFM